MKQERRRKGTHRTSGAGPPGRRTGTRRVAALCAGLALLVTSAPGAGAAEIDDLRTAVTSARQAATEATQRYMDAVNELEGLEVRIAETERDIGVSEATIVRLGDLARDRAVNAYVTRGVEIGGLDLGRPLDRLRRQKLLEQANARDNAAVQELGTAVAALATRERALRTLRTRAAESRDRLAVEQAQLDQQLAAAQSALAEFEERIRREEAARQERERARLAAQQAAARRGNGQTYDGAYVATGLVCPVPGASFIDSWGFPRATTGWHQGVDLMAPRGTPNRAVVSGRVQMMSGGTSGLGAFLYGDDGNLYYYFHFDAYEGGSRQVAQGEVIGYVGNTGDASGGATHTHFEVHPGGGAAVNPYPSVVGIC